MALLQLQTISFQEMYPYNKSVGDYLINKRKLKPKRAKT